MVSWVVWTMRKGRLIDQESERRMVEPVFSNLSLILLSWPRCLGVRANVQVYPEQSKPRVSLMCAYPPQDGPAIWTPPWSFYHISSMPPKHSPFICLSIWWNCSILWMHPNLVSQLAIQVFFTVVANAHFELTCLKNFQNSRVSAGRKMGCRQ